MTRQFLNKITAIIITLTIVLSIGIVASPTVRDRVCATELGNAAVHLLYDGIGNRVVGYKNGELVNYDIFEALNMQKTIDHQMVEIAHETSI